MTDATPLQQTFIKQYLSIPLHQHLQLSLEAFEHDQVTVKFPMQKALIGNPYTQILHGGTLAAALDAVSGLCAALTVFHKHTNLNEATIIELITQITTSSIHINYLHPGIGDFFIVTASILRSGRRLTVVESQCQNHEKTLIATSSAHFMTG